MQLRVKPNTWITTSGLSPAWTRSTARIRSSSNVLWSRARASRRFMAHCIKCLLTYERIDNHSARHVDFAIALLGFYPLFDRSMVLLQNIIQITHGTMPAAAAKSIFFFDGDTSPSPPSSTSGSGSSWGWRQANCRLPYAPIPADWYWQLGIETGMPGHRVRGWCHSQCAFNRTYILRPAQSRIN